jgi:hypothetical protein
LGLNKLLNEKFAQKNIDEIDGISFLSLTNLPKDISLKDFGLSSIEGKQF